MSGLFYTWQLTQTSRPPQGARWRTYEAYFPETQVFATIALSRYDTQNGQQFAPFEQRAAHAYIVSSETPTTSVGTVSVVTRFDNTVYLKTNHLTFQLQVQNASASAVFSIYDTTPAASFEPLQAERRLDLAVYDEDGYVVGLHSAVQLPGGADISAETVRAELLARRQADDGRALDAAVIEAETDSLVESEDIRFDPSTRRLISSG